MHCLCFLMFIAHCSLTQSHENRGKHHEQPTYMNLSQITAAKNNGSKLEFHPGKDIKYETRVKGNAVDILQYNYVVSIQADGKHICGGTIISVDYIVTSAHCMQSYLPNQLKIRAGSPMVNSGGILQNISQIFVHPAYMTVFTVIEVNDVAVIRMNSSLQFSSAIGSVKLPGSNECVLPFLLGDASGWGSENGLQTQLRNAKLITYAPPVCWKPCPQSFCAGNILTNAGVCTDDEGGPFVYNGILYGIAAKLLPGLKCYNVVMTPVFLKVSAVRDFIADVTGI